MRGITAARMRDEALGLIGTQIPIPYTTFIARDNNPARAAAGTTTANNEILRAAPLGIFDGVTINGDIIGDVTAQVQLSGTSTFRLYVSLAGVGQYAPSNITFRPADVGTRNAARDFVVANLPIQIPFAGYANEAAAAVAMTTRVNAPSLYRLARSYRECCVEKRSVLARCIKR
jgi:hypothetical protein